jgi:hypothetical protein
VFIGQSLDFVDNNEQSKHSSKMCLVQTEVETYVDQINTVWQEKAAKSARIQTCLAKAGMHQG